MELTGLSVNQQLQTSADLSSALSDVGSKSTGQTDKVLDGESVKVHSTTDLEKLVAELDAARKEKRFESLQSQYALALATLAANYEGASAEQQAAIDSVASATDAVAAAGTAVSEAQTAYDASAAELAVMTQKLEAMVEASVTTTEDRAEEISDEETLEEAAIKELEAKIEDQKEVVAKNEESLNAAKADKAAADESLATALAALDATGVAVVIKAGLTTAQMLRAAAAERANPAAVGEASAIIEALGEYVDKISEMQEEELREATAKITPELLALASADTLLAPGEFPEYESKI